MGVFPKVPRLQARRGERDRFGQDETSDASRAQPVDQDTDPAAEGLADHVEITDAEEVQGLDDVSSETVESEVERRLSVIAAAVASEVDSDHTPAPAQPPGEGIEEPRTEAIRVKEEEIRAVAAPVQYAERAGRDQEPARSWRWIAAHGPNSIVRLNLPSKSSGGLEQRTNDNSKELAQHGTQLTTRGFTSPGPRQDRRPKRLQPRSTTSSS